MNIEPAGGGMPLHSEVILTAPAGDHTDDTGNITAAVDLSAYTGQEVYLRFVWTVPEDATGPAFFQLDDIRVTSP